MVVRELVLRIEGNCLVWDQGLGVLGGAMPSRWSIIIEGVAVWAKWGMADCGRPAKALCWVEGV